MTELLNELLKYIERPGKIGRTERGTVAFIQTAKKKTLRHFMIMIARARN